MYLAMSPVFMLPPLLFVTFRNMYGISYTLLGTLVLINFLTQLSVDLIFSAFSKYFNIKAVIRAMPLFTSLGLLVYALVPTLSSRFAYLGLVIGTVIFSLSAGLGEVLLSPTVAALPSENPERDMSTLHSLYAYGSLAVIVISTLFLHFVGTEYWMYLTLFWASLPLIACYLFCTSEIPDFSVSSQKQKTQNSKWRLGFLLVVLCIFFGSAAENTMSSWISSYTESVIGLDKALGDILGMAMFAVMLGLGRTLYAKYGKNITRVLLFAMMGAIICYLTAAASPFAPISLLACALTGFFASVLWPGSLILMEEKFPSASVAAYALMAAGGDLGASIAPQLMGALTDAVSKSNFAIRLGEQLSLSREQIGMRTGLLFSAIFPIMGIVTVLSIQRYFKRKK